MTLALVRVLRERIARDSHDVVLSGIGFAHLAAWKENLPACRQLTDVADVLGRDVAGPATSCPGVLERRDGRFTAVRYLGDQPAAEAADIIRTGAGWPLDRDPLISREPDPDPADLARLRSYDPGGAFLR